MQKPAYEMRISDWSSDVCSSDLDGTLVVIDFGIMGRLDRDTRDNLADMLIGFVMRDYDLVADVHFRAGWLPREQSPAGFAQAVRSIAEPIMERPLNEISVGPLLAQTFEVTERFGMHSQPRLLGSDRGRVGKECGS